MLFVTEATGRDGIEHRSRARLETLSILQHLEATLRVTESRSRHIRGFGAPSVVKRILVVEDNPDVADLVALHLEDAGYNVDTTGQGRVGLEQAMRGEHDLVVLDLMLPDLDGLEICRRLRAREQYIPILMLTARSAELDRVLGLEIGGDDYMTKPFGIRELLARIRALLRRVEALRTGPVERDRIEVGPFVLDSTRRSAAVEGAALELTAKEFDLLLHFARHPGRVYGRAELLDQVWGYGHRGYAHTVNTHINRLRSKIEADPSAPRYVLTVWGVGYRFFDPAQGEA